MEASSGNVFKFGQIIIPRGMEGPQWGSIFLIGLKTEKSVKILFSETDWPEKLLLVWKPPQLK